MKVLSITPAKHGGYIVTQSGGEYGEIRQPLFAGSLADALDFMREQYTATPAGSE